MTDGLLENIIHLEKQIQASVSAEQVRAEQWQERELAALQRGAVQVDREVCGKLIKRSPGWAGRKHRGASGSGP